MNYENSIKDIHRKKCVTANKTYRRIIDLAGEKALSIKSLQKGNINADCDITIIDHNKKKLARAKQRIAKLGLQVHGHHGKIESYTPSGEYDWVNLDTCNSFSLELGQWLSQLKMSPNGEVNIWLTCYRSKGQLLESLDETFSTKTGRQVMRSLHKHCLGADGLLSNIPRKKRTEARATVGALAASFSQSFDVMPVQEYTVHVNRMYVYRFVNFGNGQLKFPDLSDFRVESDYKGQTYKSTSTKPKSSIGESSSVDELVFAAIKTGRKSYATKRIRQFIHEKKLRGNSDVKWIKAGWKARISALTKDAAHREQCHNLIDNA